ncbi:MAG: 30S ribosomal protein S17 [Kiritimatiellae bacterium]|nr:30S ribosomal protein S17 [Kiritimatiellia bacterium]
MTEKTESQQVTRKQRNGTVVSVSGEKSVVVRVETRRRHPMYSKVVRVHRKFHAHDESSQAKVGDKVQIEECRPYSKMKRWRVTTIEATKTVA